jgi:hypothetical protein
LNILRRYFQGGRQADPEVQNARPLLFIHIPKTAGTSFRSELEQYFGGEAVFPGSWYLERLYRGDYPPVEQFTRDIEALRRKIRVVTGHYPYSQLISVLSDVDRAVFLREPVARAISYLEHARARVPRFSGSTFEAIAGLEGERPNPEIVNLQTRFLSTHRRPEERLDSALANLKAFEFVGITERYRESITLCNRIFKLRLAGSRHDNAGGGRCGEVSRELRQYLHQHNRDDLVLYRAALAQFRRPEDRPKPD